MGDDETVCAAFDHWIASCELPVEIHIQYDWQRGTGLMCLDIESRCKMTTTSLFKAIEPYEVY